MVGIKCFHFSTWRLFGWGMYATPDTESYSQLAILYVNGTLNGKVEIEKIYNKIEAMLRQPERNSTCINLFFYDKNSKVDVVQLPSRGVCRGRGVDTALDYFYQFGSIDYLHKLVHFLSSHAGQEVSEAFVFHTIQRLDLQRMQAYTQHHVYDIKNPGKTHAVRANREVSLAALFKERRNELSKE